MSNIIQDLERREVFNKGSVPHWLPKSCEYLVKTGSEAYGCPTNLSDVDVYGFCVQSKKTLFPHLDGKIYGFDEIKPFKQWQLHGVVDTAKKKEYDFTVFGLTRYFELLMGCNPNILDSLWSPSDCILHCTPLAGLIKSNRKVFLSKKLYHTFRGYSAAQISKLDRVPSGKRKESFDKWGFDLKYAMHAVRLSSQLSQFLETGDMDLRRDSEVYKAIRRGEWTLDRVKNWLNQEELNLQRLNDKTELPHSPNKTKIKRLLIECIEMKYGSLTKMLIATPDADKSKLDRIKEILDE